MRLALFQPDIPQNSGTILRLAACFGLPVDIIEPCGFLWDDKRVRRSLMDYAEAVEIHRHRSWHAFTAERTPGRLVLLTTKATTDHLDFAFAPDDILMFGRESAGVPDEVAEACDARIRIPLRPGLRSLNVAMTAALITGEALRQVGGFPRGL